MSRKKKCLECFEAIPFIYWVKDRYGVNPTELIYLSDERYLRYWNAYIFYNVG